MHFPPAPALPWLLPYLPLFRLATRSPSLARSPERTAGPLVSVVIPARNEAAVIETVVRSVLASRYADLEVVVVDDRSTDATAAIVERLAAADPRVRLVRGADLPEGWFGKPWACVQGYRATRGDLLLFTDADTVHAPALLGHAVGALETERADLVTVMSQQVCLTPAERLVMPQFFFLLGTRYHPAAVNRARAASQVVANGQFILVPRAAYEAVGTHERVRGEVAEDLALAQEFFTAGRKLYFAYALELMQTRMYTGLAHLVEGWSKNLYLGARRAYPDSPLMQALAPAFTAVAFLFWLVPPVALLLGLAGAWPAATGPALWATGFSALFWTAASAGMGIPFWYGVLYPAGAAIATWICFRSAFRGRRRVEWKGRVYAPGR
jgi:chlorobactene glucosyltransferase